MNGGSAENNIGPLIIFRRSSFAAMPTQAAIYQGSQSRGGGKQKEMKTHLPGIHNTSIFSRESKDFQTLNNGTAEGSTVAATADHLMLGAASKNSNSVSGRGCLGLLIVDRDKLLSSVFSSKGGRSP